MSCHISRLIALGTVANTQQTTHDDNCESNVSFENQKCQHGSSVDCVPTLLSKRQKNGTQDFISSHHGSSVDCVPHRVPCVPNTRRECVSGVPPLYRGGRDTLTGKKSNCEPEKVSFPWLPFAQRDDSTRGLGLAVKVLSQLPEVTP